MYNKMQLLNIIIWCVLKCQHTRTNFIIFSIIWDLQKFKLEQQVMTFHGSWSTFGHHSHKWGKFTCKAMNAWIHVAQQCIDIWNGPSRYPAATWGTTRMWKPVDPSSPMMEWYALDYDTHSVMMSQDEVNRIGFWNSLPLQPTMVKSQAWWKGEFSKTVNGTN